MGFGTIAIATFPLIGSWYLIPISIGSTKINQFATWKYLTSKIYEKKVWCKGHKKINNEKVYDWLIDDFIAHCGQFKGARK